MIEHSFKKCGISNNLDGTDDDENICLVHTATVSDADASDTDTWDDAAMLVLAAFFNSDDESDFEGF